MGVLCGDVGIPWALGGHGPALETTQCRMGGGSGAAKGRHMVLQCIRLAARTELVLAGCWGVDDNLGGSVGSGSRQYDSRQIQFGPYKIKP